jgi:hypothetical protein
LLGSLITSGRNATSRCMSALGNQILDLIPLVVGGV